ncbi:MAG: hypothetical protein JWP29_2439 [Rhodoferax sp.]|nr:hypothetical protein [Rhodoferax sp.]
MPSLQSLPEFFTGLFPFLSRDPRRKAYRLWKQRPCVLRTVTHIHSFEAELWSLGVRLGPTSLEHHLALMYLLKDVIVAPAAEPPPTSREP